MRKFDYALFDLDGTLVDSSEGIIRCIRHALEVINVRDVPEEKMRSFIGPPFRSTLRSFPQVDAQTMEAMLKVYRSHYDSSGWKELKVYDGIFDLLKTLKDAGMTLAVATSKPARFTNKVIEHFGFSPYFSYVGAAEEDGVRDRKSEVIEHVLKTLNIEDRSRVVMIGDTRYDVNGARESGVACAAVLWGFGKEEDLVAAGAKNLFKTIKELESYLL
jgi:phosphoglycolate phosphatase